MFLEPELKLRRPAAVGHVAMENPIVPSQLYWNVSIQCMYIYIYYVSGGKNGMVRL